MFCMDIKSIAATVQKCGSEAQDVVTRSALYDDWRERRTLAASWMQAKMLGEIAYQLAVMNDRNALEDERLHDRVTGISAMLTTLEGRVDRLEPPIKSPDWCGAVSPDRKGFCGLPKNHSDSVLHGWERGEIY
jgi:hypothetical protein